MSTTHQPKRPMTLQTELGAVTVHKNPRGAPKKGGALRVSAKMRKAIRYRVRRNYTISDACEKAGITESGYHKNMKKPHILAVYQAEIEQYVQEVESLEKRHKARALEVGGQLLDNASSDAVKARMVEFFRGGRANGVSVTVNNTVNSGGYEYARPTQKIVEIEGTAEDVTEITPDDKAN